MAPCANQGLLVNKAISGIAPHQPR